MNSSASRMRIAYALPQPEEFGFGRYLRLLLSALTDLDPENEYLLFTTSASGIRARIREIALPPKRPTLRWRQSVLAPACREFGVDCVHFHNSTTFLRKPVPTIVSLHHVTYAYPPEEAELSWFERRYVRWLYRHIARTSDAVVTDSRHSAQDLHRLLGIDPAVIPLAADPALRPASRADVQRVREKYSLRKPYFFFPGSLGIRKNLPGMIRAFERFARGFEFVLSGSPPSAIGYRAVPEADLDHPGVRRIGFVPAEDLAPLYSGATALLYVTYYEGFGMPILEAFACGCPVIASTTASAPEIAGDAAILVDPDDETGMVAALERIVDGASAFVDRGFRRVREFSWERTARETLAVYRAVLS